MSSNKIRMKVHNTTVTPSTIPLMTPTQFNAWAGASVMGGQSSLTSWKGVVMRLKPTPEMLALKQVTRLVIEDGINVSMDNFTLYEMDAYPNVPNKADYISAIRKYWKLKNVGVTIQYKEAE